MKKDPLNKCKEKELPKRVDKALAWLISSRDNWKEKCIDAKLKLKRLTQDNNRVRASREEWRLRHARLKSKLIRCEKKNVALQSRIIELEHQLKEKNNELHGVKKKQ